MKPKQKHPNLQQANNFQPPDKVSAGHLFQSKWNCLNLLHEYVVSWR